MEQEAVTETIAPIVCQVNTWTLNPVTGKRIVVVLWSR